MRGKTMKLARRGQISLEFMLVFGIMLILMLYSVNNVTFRNGSTATETLGVQILLEGKNLANSIAGSVAQVYSQGPGSKVTTYTSVTYLAEPEYLKKAFNSTKVNIGLSNDEVRVWVGTQMITQGADKNTATTSAPYTPSSVVLSFPQGLPAKNVKIVVEWNPDRAEGMSSKVSNDYLEIDININPGGGS